MAVRDDWNAMIQCNGLPGTWQVNLSYPVFSGLILKWHRGRKLLKPSVEHIFTVDRTFVHINKVSCDF